MNGFEPRLLLPGTPGIPAHMVVSHDPRVYDVIEDPVITAAVYVPNWSPPVREAFERIAALTPEKQHNIEDRIHLAGFSAGDVEDFALGCIIRWLRPAFKPDAREENIHVVHEVAAAHTVFVSAAQRLLRPNLGRMANLHAISRRLNMDDEAGTRLQPQHPHTSAAHTDPSDNALFSKPLGTVLVDQAGLDIKALRYQDVNTVKHGKLIHRIALTHLANRLWQTPDASFGLWRGEGHPAAQYHFFPHITHDVQRFRTFMHP